MTPFADLRGKRGPVTGIANGQGIVAGRASALAASGARPRERAEAARIGGPRFT